MRTSLFMFYVLVAVLMPDAQSAQPAVNTIPPTHAGKRSLMPRDSEIALARSAAPASVSADATVLVFTDSGFVRAVSGSNGVTCIVNRSWPQSVEPHCFDAEGTATILPMEIYRTLAYHRGKTEKEADKAIAAGLTNGTFRLPERPAMSYMMSARQRLVDDDGSIVGKWRPHIMIYSPYLTNKDVGLSAKPDMSVGMVAEEGKPTASIMIVMRDFTGTSSK